MAEEMYVITKEYRFKRRAGDSGSLEITVPLTISLSGKSLAFQVKDENGGIKFTKTTTDNQITVDAVTGLVSIRVERIDSYNLLGKYRWGLLMYEGGDYSTIGIGTYELTERAVTI